MEKLHLTINTSEPYINRNIEYSTLTSVGLQFLDEIENIFLEYEWAFAYYDNDVSQFGSMKAKDFAELYVKPLLIQGHDRWYYYNLAPETIIPFEDAQVSVK